MAPEQLDSALLLKRFLALFPQRFGSTFRASGGTAWRAMSQFHYLEDDSILASLGSSSKNIRACLLDQKTTFLAVSCLTGDDGIDFHAVKLVVEQLRCAGLKPCIYKESGSTDIQIFLAFSGLVETDRAAEVIAAFLENKRVAVHDTRKPFVLPLQQGFAWLNPDFAAKVECDQIALEAAMAMFLHDLNSNSVAPDVLQALSEQQQHSKECDFPADSLLLEAIDPATEGLEQLNFDEPLPDLLQTDPGINSQESEVESILPAEMPAATNQVRVPGGQQLLLFPVDPQVVQFEQPKERPKRKKRARSDLPADNQPKVFIPTHFTALPTDAHGVLQSLKEAPDD